MADIDGAQLNSDEDAEVPVLGGPAYEAAKELRVALSYRARFWQQTDPSGPKEGETIQPEHITKASLEFGFW